MKLMFSKDLLLRYVGKRTMKGKKKRKGKCEKDGKKHVPFEKSTTCT